MSPSISHPAIWNLADAAKNDSSSGGCSDGVAAAAELDDLLERLYPICRSITGDGVRETLQILQERAPLEIHEVPSGSRVLDWEVPLEWRVNEAWIKGPSGDVVVDFAELNLHLLGYSSPFSGVLSRQQLDEHLYSDPERPADVPYRTSYYVERWGFCLPHEQRQSLEDGDYEVLVDTVLEPGSLSYGELLVPGQTQREILVSSHVCHPSLANDNLSGLAVTSELARRLLTLQAEERRYSYRFLWAPGTIGAITWLARHREHLDLIDHGLVAANLGDPGGFHYKRSRQGDADVDRAVELSARDLGIEPRGRGLRTLRLRRAAVLLAWF